MAEDSAFRAWFRSKKDREDRKRISMSVGGKESHSKEGDAVGEINDTIVGRGVSSRRPRKVKVPGSRVKVKQRSRSSRGQGQGQAKVKAVEWRFQQKSDRRRPKVQ